MQHRDENTRSMFVSAHVDLGVTVLVKTIYVHGGAPSNFRHMELRLQLGGSIRL